MAAKRAGVNGPRSMGAMSDENQRKGCPHCGGDDLYVTSKPVPAGGGYAPDLLPGLHPWYRSARLHAVLCAKCGYYAQFAEEEARRAVQSSPKWRKL